MQFDEGKKRKKCKRNASFEGFFRLFFFFFSFVHFFFFSPCALRSHVPLLLSKKKKDKQEQARFARILGDDICSQSSRPFLVMVHGSFSPSKKEKKKKISKGKETHFGQGTLTHINKPKKGRPMMSTCILWSPNVVD